MAVDEVVLSLPEKVSGQRIMTLGGTGPPLDLYGHRFSHDMLCVQLDEALK